MLKCDADVGFVLSVIHSRRFLMLFQHAILLIKSAMEYAIPDVPSEVATEMAKVEFQRREALKVSTGPMDSLTFVLARLGWLEVVL